MQFAVICAVSVVSSLFQANCRGSSNSVGWPTLGTASDANVHVALRTATNAVRNNWWDAVHMLIIPDDVTVTRVSDGVLLRLTDGTAHACDDWVTNDYVLRTMVADPKAVMAAAVAANVAGAHIQTGAGVVTGKRVAVINVTDPFLSASTAQRASTPTGYVGTWMSTRGVYIPVPLSTAPTTVLAPALVTLLANPPSGSGAPALTSTADLHTLPAVFTIYMAIYTNTPNPGPQMLNLATLSADMDAYYMDTMVEEAMATVGRILGWVGGVTAQRIGWDGAVALFGGEVLNHWSVRHACISTGSVQAGVNAGWVGTSAPIGALRTSVGTADPLIDGMVQTGAWYLLTQPVV